MLFVKMVWCTSYVQHFIASFANTVFSVVWVRHQPCVFFFCHGWLLFVFPDLSCHLFFVFAFWADAGIHGPFGASCWHRLMLESMALLVLPAGIISTTNFEA